MLKLKKYKAGLFQRFGALPKGLVNSIKGHEVIWLHAVSVGEVQAALPLINELLVKFRNFKFVISTTTDTGQKVAKELLNKHNIFIFYFPLDLFWVIGKVLDTLKPKIVIILETEIWPAFLDHCFKLKIPIGIVNGRLSDKSFRGYSKIRFFLKPLLNQMKFVAAQTESDKNKFIQLGVEKGRISSVGNLKFDQTPKDATLNDSQLSDFNLLKNKQLLIAGSTHRGEEEILLSALKSLITKHHTLTLLLAPRHPERISEVVKIVNDSNFSPIFRSHLSLQTSIGKNNVLILDTMGELARLYQLATIVFIGKSLIPKGGGQNPLEPALYGKPIIVGPNVSNFKSIYSDLKKSQAVLEINDEKSLKEAIDTFLNEPKTMETFGNNAMKAVARNRGATDRTIKLIDQFF